MIRVHIINSDDPKPQPINQIEVIIDWQCNNCYRIKSIKDKDVLPKCARLTIDNKICIRQLIKF